MEEGRTVEAVIETEETTLEEKSKYVLTVGVKRHPTLRNLIPEVNYSVESGRNFNLSVIENSLK